MELIQDQAIVLRVLPFEDRHKIVTAITRDHGRLSAMARNAAQSRRFGCALEPFAVSRWSFAGRLGAELFRLDEAETCRVFEGLRGDFGKLALASAFNEIVLKLTRPGEPCRNLYRLHSNALVAVEESEAPSPALLNAYIIKALQWSGTPPRIHHCLECGATVREQDGGAKLLCMISDGGWLCPGCRNAARPRNSGSSVKTIEVTASAMADCCLALASPIRKAIRNFLASPAEHEELFSYLEALLVFHVPGFDRTPLKSLRFLGTAPKSTPRPP